MNHHAVGAVEVVLTWRDAQGQCAVLDADLIDASERPALWIGSRGDRFTLPREVASMLGAREHFCLVRFEDVHFVLYLPKAATVTLSMHGVPVRIAAACTRIVLAIGNGAEVRLGAFSLLVRAGDAAQTPFDRGRFIDRPAARWVFAALLVHLLLVSSFFAPPNVAALRLEQETRRVTQVRLLADAPPPPLRTHPRVYAPVSPRTLAPAHRQLYVPTTRPAPPRRIHVAMLEPTVEGQGLSRLLIDRVVRRHLNEVRFCYEQTLMTHPAAEGRIAVQFIVNANGEVSVSSLSEASNGTARAGSCIAQAVRRWAFPNSIAPTLVRYPFALSSMN